MMKLGFLTGSVADLEKARKYGFAAIELHVNAFGDPLKAALDKDKLAAAKKLMQQTGVGITALAFYHCGAKKADTPLAPTWFTRIFDAADELGVKTVTTMSGFDASLNWDQNLQFWADRFGPVAALAEKRGFKVGFENWCGYWGKPPYHPVNMGGCPDTWEKWFKLVPSKALGLEFDPSHLYWQGIDHIRALKEFKDRVVHVHAKDTQMDAEAQYRHGFTTLPFRFRIPGYGEICWAQFITALQEVGYDGGVAIEHEDPVYCNERFDEGLERGRNVLLPLINPAAPRFA